MRRVTAACGLALLAAGIALTVTQHGVALSPDSRWYHDIANGTRVTAHFPPGYPWLLTVMDDRVIAVGSFALLIGFVALAFRPRAAIVLLITPAIVWVHTWAWSEPPFMVAMVVFVWGVKQKQFAVATGALIAMVLLRHAAIAFVPVLAFAVWNERRFLGLLYLAPLAASLITLRAARVYAWHPPTSADWQEFGGTAARALIPLFGGWWLVIAAGVSAAMIAKRISVARVDRTAMYCAVSYTLFVLTARTIADPLIPFDKRIFAPAMVLLTIGVIPNVELHGRIGYGVFSAWLSARLAVTTLFVISTLS